MPSVSQRDVAQRAGVSVSAVSLALRNHPKVSDALRARVQEIARELGYRRDPRLSELTGHLRTARARRAPSKLAVLVPDLLPPELEQHAPIRTIIAGAAELADEAGFALDSFHLNSPGMTTPRMRDILLARGIQGVFVAPFARGTGRLDFDFTGFAASTAGYSVLAPGLSRACLNHLQMLGQIFPWVRDEGYERPGLVLTPCGADTEHQLITSAFLYFQLQVPPKRRLAPLVGARLSDFALLRWIAGHRPDVILGSDTVHEQLRRLGALEAGGFDFVRLEFASAANEARGLDHHRRVGREAIKLILSQLMLHQTGVPEHPKTVLIDTTWQPDRVASRVLTARANGVSAARSTRSA